MARVVLHWKGQAIEPRELPAGDYIVARYKPRKLTPAEQEGIRSAVQSIDRGEGIPWEKVRASLDDRLKRRRQRKKKPR